MIVDKYKTDLPDSLKDTFAKDTSPLPDDDDTAQLFAGLVGIIPKARNLRLLLLVLEFYSSLIDVKDTSPTYPDVL